MGWSNRGSATRGSFIPLLWLPVALNKRKWINNSYFILLYFIIFFSMEGRTHTGLQYVFYWKWPYTCQCFFSPELRRVWFPLLQTAIIQSQTKHFPLHWSQLFGSYLNSAGAAVIRKQQLLISKQSVTTQHVTNWHETMWSHSLQCCLYLCLYNIRNDEKYTKL